jgi:hypothetical protein
MLGASSDRLAGMIVLASLARSAPPVELSCQADGLFAVQPVSNHRSPWADVAQVSRARSMLATSASKGFATVVSRVRVNSVSRSRAPDSSPTRLYLVALPTLTSLGRPTSACSGARAARSFRLPLTPLRAPADA